MMTEAERAEIAALSDIEFEARQKADYLAALNIPRDPEQARKLSARYQVALAEHYRAAMNLSAAQRRTS